MFRQLGVALFMVLSVALAVSGCDSSSSDNNNNNPPALGTVTGTSGAAVSMDGAWSRGCIVSVSDGQVNESVFTLNGGAISVADSTWLDITNTTCTGTPDIAMAFNGTGSIAGTVDAISWVDSNGTSAAAPTGLETVTTANAALFTADSATMTPNTQAGADALNLRAQCGLTDWAAGVTKEVLTCIWTDSQDNPLPNPEKESWVIDDTTSTTQLSWYSGQGTTVVDANGYPTEIENSDPTVK